MGGAQNNTSVYYKLFALVKCHRSFVKFKYYLEKYFLGFGILFIPIYLQKEREREAKKRELRRE